MKAKGKLKDKAMHKAMHHDRTKSFAVDANRVNIMQAGDVPDTRGVVDFTEDLWDGFADGSVARINGDSNALMKMMRKDITYLAEVQKNYGDALKGLDNTAPPASAVVGPQVSEAIRSFREDIHRLGTMHQVMATTLHERILRPLEEFRKEQKHRRKDVDIEMARLGMNLQVCVRAVVNVCCCCVLYVVRYVLCWS
jgi:hypothetical protein